MHVSIQTFSSGTGQSELVAIPKPFTFMTPLTHATIAAAGAKLILGTANPLALSLAILGSQLPALDTSTSTIGQICYPINSWIENRFPTAALPTYCWRQPSVASFNG